MKDKNRIDELLLVDNELLDGCALTDTELLEKKRVKERSLRSVEKAKRKGIKLMGLRMPLDWIATLDKIAEARRQTRTAVVYSAVRKAWLEYLHEEAEIKKLEDTLGRYREGGRKKPWIHEQLRLNLKG